MRPENRDDADGEQHDGEGEEHVHDAHDDAVEPAAVIGGDETERSAGEKRDPDREQAGDERGAIAVEDAGQHVAAELIGAEPVQRRTARAGASALRHGIVGREQRRPDGEDDLDRHQDDGEGELVLGQTRHGFRLSRGGRRRCRESRRESSRTRSLPSPRMVAWISGCCARRWRRGSGGRGPGWRRPARRRWRRRADSRS